MISPDKARAILDACSVPTASDFHALPAYQVDWLLDYADAHRYRKPRNANGSRARHWHACLSRRAARNAS